MNNKTQKWLTVAGCLAICAVLVVLIGSGFTREPVQDDPLPALDADAGDLTINPDTESADAGAKGDEAPVVVVKPDTSIPTDNGGNSGAVYTGTEQTIQPDVTKPEYDEEDLKDPTKTPDGTPVTEPPKHEDHDSVTPPPATEKPNNGGNSSGGLPGFDNVPNGGPNKGEQLDDMYENGNKIGIMG